MDDYAAGHIAEEVRLQSCCHVDLFDSTQNAAMPMLPSLHLHLLLLLAAPLDSTACETTLL